MFNKKSRDYFNLAPIILNGQELPWVKKVTHLGNVLEADNSMKADIAIKRGKFIGKVNSLLQEFHYVSSQLLIKLVNVYASSFYGSCLLDLLSKDVERIYTTWNVTVRNVFRLDRSTHRVLIEPLSDCLHLKVMLLSRYVSFHRELIRSPKISCGFLPGYKRST